MNKSYAAAFASIFLATACSTTDKLSRRDHSKYDPLTVREILSDSNHTDKVHVTGEIIEKIKSGIFRFKGQHGNIIEIHIDSEDIPDEGLRLNSSTIIRGEVIKAPAAPVYLDADNIRYVF